ncbi:MAG: VOC family protein [Sandaracinaceae bacterium]
MLAGHDVISLLPTRDAERSRAFYEGTLGLRFIEDDGFALAFEVGQRFLRITRVETLTPQPFSVIGWMVPDVAATAAQLVEAGVTLRRYPFLEQDDLGVWATPDGRARIIWFEDPDGNLLSAVETQPSRP